MGEEVSASFYKQELIKANQAIFRTDKIIKKKDCKK